jgi:hypothetical protein
VVGEPDVDVLVGVADAVLGERIRLQRPPDGHRGCRKHRETDQRDDDESDHRVSCKPATRVFGDAAGAGVEHVSRVDGPVAPRERGGGCDSMRGFPVDHQQPVHGETTCR